MFDRIRNRFAQGGKEVREIVLAYRVRSRKIGDAFANHTGQMRLWRNPEVENRVMDCHHSW
ncbi:MAG: hypothetical protein NVS3B17_14010 [Vulcanimicrobiaceae bacterium]